MIVALQKLNSNRVLIDKYVVGARHWNSIDIEMYTLTRK